MSSVVVVPLCSALVKARLDWRRCSSRCGSSVWGNAGRSYRSAAAAPWAISVLRCSCCVRWRWSARHSAALGTTPHWTAPDVVQAPTIPAELYQPVIVTGSAGVTPDRWWSLDTNGARLGSQTRQPHLMAALYPPVGVGSACPQSRHRMVSPVRSRRSTRWVRSTKSWMLGVAAFMAVLWSWGGGLDCRTNLLQSTLMFSGVSP